MDTGGPELVIALISAVALLLAPLASKLIADVGAEVSRELDGGRTGAGLTSYLDRRYGGFDDGRDARVEEIRQLLEARAFVQRRRGRRPLDVEAELRRILAREE